MKKNAAAPLKPTRTTEQRRARVIELGRVLPGVEVTDLEPHGNESEVWHAKFAVGGKTFAYYQFDHHGDGVVSLCCKAPPGCQQELIAEDPERFFRPDYVGARGWVGVRLDRRAIDWDAIDALLRGAYRMTAPKKLAMWV